MPRKSGKASGPLRRTAVAEEEEEDEPPDAHIDVRGAMAEAMSSFQSHAILVWALMPVFVAAQCIVPQLRPSAECGFPTASLAVVGLVVVHHVVAEHRAWHAAKSLLTRPELTVMHQIGVLRKRRRLLLLGIIEDLDLFTDLNFPFMAYACDKAIHGHFMKSWELVPMFGKYFAFVLRHLRFWGLSAILVSLALMGALASVARLSRTPQVDAIVSYKSLSAEEKAEQSYYCGTPRMSGEQFFTMARYAETALMPSVAQLCEEMGSQRRWVYDAKPKTGGALGMAKAYSDAVLGKNTYDDLERFELQNIEERDRVDGAQWAFYVMLLFGRTLVCNGMQLWLQASFFALSYEYLGEEAMVKLCVGMALSSIQICARCVNAVSKLGLLGVGLSIANVAVLLWAAAKVYFAFKCEDHVWGISTGCVRRA